MQIRTGGPMSVGAYMALCASHPRQGYYRVAQPLGIGGDFVTAPEISQMFGELIGAFMLNMWQQMGPPERFTLLELGPGRGTLMADMLRVTNRYPQFRKSMDLRLFESNAVLIETQKKHLPNYAPVWIETLDELPEQPLLVVANEFFDALPVRQFIKRGGAWRERMVGLDGETRVFGLSPTPLPNQAMPESVRAAGEDEIYEVSLASRQVMAQLAPLVARHGGAMLIIDYGYAKTRTGETLQAVRRHAFADPLDNPGETDISAHVNFEVLANAARAAELMVEPLTEQGIFLERLGIRERAAALKASVPSASASIDGAVERLTGRTAMGTLFKVLCATSPGLNPPGFE